VKKDSRQAAHLESQPHQLLTISPGTLVFLNPRKTLEQTTLGCIADASAAAMIKNRGGARGLQGLPQRRRQPR